MNKTKKYLALLSAVVLSFALLPSCEKDKESSDDKSVETTHTTETSVTESTTETKPDTTTATIDSSLSIDTTTIADETEPVNNNGGEIRTDFYETDSVPSEYMQIYSELVTSLSTADETSIKKVLFEPYLIIQNYISKTYMNMSTMEMLSVGLEYMVEDTAFISQSTTTSFNQANSDDIKVKFNEIINTYLSMVEQPTTDEDSTVDNSADIAMISSYLNAEFTDCYIGEFDVTLNGVSNGKTAPLSITCAFAKYNGVPYIVYFEIQ